MILSYKRLLALICCVLTISLLSSCKKEDDDTDNGQVQLLSFGPTGANPGDTLRFIGHNLDKVTEIQFTGTGATVNQSDFKQQTADLILALVPQSAEKGYVTLKTSDGEIVSKTQLNLGVEVTIASVTGEARPGENITITGNFLNWVNSVTFAKDKVVTTFVSQSMNQLVVAVPMDAQTGPLQISVSGTDSTVFETDDTVKVALPAIASISPNPVEREKELTITGTNLDLVQGVLFNGVADTITEFVSKAATQLVVKVPKETTKGKIALLSYSGIKIESAAELTLAGDLPPLADFTLPIYTDALQSGFQDWSYTDTHDFNSTFKVRQGEKSIKAVYGSNGYQGLTFHNPGTAVSTSGYTKLEFSVYADAASNGKKLQVVTNGAYGGAVPQVTLVGGEWTTFSVTLASMGSPASIGEIVLQGAGFTGTVYIDHVGLR